MRTIEIQREHSDITDVLKFQRSSAMLDSVAVDEYINKKKGNVSFDDVRNLYYIGYIEGKRSERAKRKKGNMVQTNR